MDEILEAAIKTLRDEIRGHSPRYGWAGIATNAYEDKQKDILPLAKISDDIARKTMAVQAGTIPHYGLLDVMHNHDMTIGMCAYRKILDGTRMEVDFGYIDDEYAEVAEAMMGKNLTMSHEFRYTVRIGKTQTEIPIEVADALGMKFSRAIEYIHIDTFRFTVAVAGEEANRLTTFKVYELGKT